MQRTLFSLRRLSKSRCILDSPGCTLAPLRSLSVSGCLATVEVVTRRSMCQSSFRRLFSDAADARTAPAVSRKRDRSLDECATNTPTTLYSDGHDWIKVKLAPDGWDKVSCTVGLSQYIESTLGEIVHVDLPAIGEPLKRGDCYATVESVKTVNELYSPMDGVVTKVNELLKSDPQLINKSPLGGGWLIEMEVATKTYQKVVDSLMNADSYDVYTKGS